MPMEETAFSPRTLIESVAEDMEALGATVQLHGRAEQPLNARPQSLRRCLGNLMDNARRHAGGVIDVTISELPECVEVRIEDRGRMQGVRP